MNDFLKFLACTSLGLLIMAFIAGVIILAMTFPIISQILKWFGIAIVVIIIAAMIGGMFMPDEYDNRGV